MECPSMGGRKSGDYPNTIAEFRRRFPWPFGLKSSPDRCPGLIVKSEGPLADGSDTARRSLSLDGAAERSCVKAR